jgi:hypothetical protein
MSFRPGDIVSICNKDRAYELGRIVVDGSTKGSYAPGIYLVESLSNGRTAWYSKRDLTHKTDLTELEKLLFDFLQ